MPQTSDDQAPGRRGSPPGGRKQVGRAIQMWVAVTLGGVAILGALVIWHLVRRGRRVRERLGPPREILWPDVGPRVASAKPTDGNTQ